MFVHVQSLYFEQDQPIRMRSLVFTITLLCFDSIQRFGCKDDVIQHLVTAELFRIKSQNIPSLPDFFHNQRWNHNFSPSGDRQAENTNWRNLAESKRNVFQPTMNVRPIGKRPIGS
ncbi:uncharacterized protein LOC142348305 isoform X2 [Convolutriloba macropyga]|uniref:uncharacterized protein LOC142348305 isoform X2 n=1 Tax=Convolutriloba macropyga TaxID=536237 RepID=UPI003F51D660